MIIIERIIRIIIKRIHPRNALGWHKKTVTLFLMMATLSNGLESADKKWSENFYLHLKTTSLILPWVDYGMTVFALKYGGGDIYEANPVTRMYVDRPMIAIPVILLSTYAFNLVTDWIWKEDRTIAIVLQVLNVVARSVVIYLNMRVITK